MNTPTRFREYDPNQLMLLPPDLRDWLPRHHVRPTSSWMSLANWICRWSTDRMMGPRGVSLLTIRGMMVGLLLLAYCEGITITRRIERATYDSVASSCAQFGSAS